jgi:hypothetical protein
VGAEATTTLRLGRQTFAGTALLETDELRFRGETRLRIPLGSVQDVSVKHGSLHVTHAEGVAVFGLGTAAAAKWADRIRSPRSLADKLDVTPAARVAGLTYTNVVRFSETDTAEKLVIPRAAR